jgi:pilus assembly protein CpaF
MTGSPRDHDRSTAEDAVGDPELDPLVEELSRRVAHVPGEVHDVVRRHVRAVAPLADATTRTRLVDMTVARLAGLDVLDRLLTDPTVDEVLVNRGGEVWIDRRGELRRGPALHADTVPTVLERVLAPLGRRLDRSTPIVDARLPDGSRVCAVVPPVAVDGPVLSIRRFARRPRPLDTFATPAVRDLLLELLALRCNLVIVGATSSGKTSLLGALLDTLDPTERVVLLEDTAELVTGAAHLVRLEARTPTADGVRAVPLEELVRTALRLRPDRLVVGEVRGPEVLGLVQAMNTGHDGSLSTCHANGTLDALHRLETLVLQAAPGWPLAAIRAHLGRSIDVIVRVERRGRERTVSEIAEVVCHDGPDRGERPAVRPLAVDGRVLARPTRGRT